MAKKLPSAGLPYLKTVKRGAKVYEYFNAGPDVMGKLIYKALPPRSDKGFGGAYASLMAARTARERRAPSPTMRHLIQAYQLTEKFKKRAHSTQDTYLIYLRQLGDLMGDAPVNDVKRSDVDALMEQMEARPGAANMMLTVLRNLFRLATKREWTAVDPTKDVGAVEGDGRMSEPWPDDLLAKGLAHPEYGLAVALLYYTAQRIGDVCRMTWADIENGDDDVIHVVQEKTGAELWPPLHPALAEHLLRSVHDHPTILYGPGGKPLKKDTLRVRLQRWAETEGHSIEPHGLRKNAVIALLEAGCSTGEIASISGQTLKIVEHYAKRFNRRRMGGKAMRRWAGT